MVIATLNRRASLAACLESVLALDHPSFEVLVCVDPRGDTSPGALARIAETDSRVRVLVSERAAGVSATRNAGVLAAAGELVFFTDDDVIVPADWLRHGCGRFAEVEVVGIEGRIVYVSDDYRQRYGDRVVENHTGGMFMTANAAYRRAALLAVGMFDETLARFEDRELAHRLHDHGVVRYAPECVVYHQHVRYTFASFLAEAARVGPMLRVMKRTGHRSHLVGPVYAPAKLVAIACPPVILLRLLERRIGSVSDFAFLALAYPRLCCERLLLWRAAAVERYFVV